MKWQDHKRLSEIAVKKVYPTIPPSVLSRIVEASVLPDITPDYDLVPGKRKQYVKKRVNHHSSRGKYYALYYLKKARKALKKNNPMWTEYFGKALHYIQDYPVPTDRKFLKFFRIKDMSYHNTLELAARRVKYFNVPDVELENIHDGLGMIKKLKKKDSSKEIIEEALKGSVVAAKLLFDPPIREKYVKWFKRWAILHFGAIAAVVAGSAYKAYATGDYYSAYLGLIIGIIIHYVDIVYHYLHTEAKW